MRTCIPVELIEALEGYLDRHPKNKNIKIHSSCMNGKGILMGDMPNEIRKGSEVGIDYEKALYKMAFEDLISGSKKLDLFQKKGKTEYMLLNIQKGEPLQC